MLCFGCQDLAFCPYGEYWRQVKKVCVLELLSRKGANFEFVRKEETAKLVEVALCMRCFTGKVKKASKELHGFLDQVIEEHQVSKSQDKDIVDILLQIEKNGMLTVDFTRESMKAVLMRLLNVTAMIEIKKYREAAMIEIEVLQQLGKHDKGRNRCVQIRNWFDYRNHICIVFEKLGPSLYDFLRKNNYRSFPIDLVREIGGQLLECVAFMHDLRLIHTDLKPENILLVSPDYVRVPDYKGLSRSPKEGSYVKRVPKSSAIKVIDFGSTTYERQDQNYIVSTRHYRAPEVILGLGWSYPCDIWSVGCILVELCTGEALFQTHENLEHLAMMERVLGPLPQHMLKRVDRHAEKYIRRGRLDWPEGATSRESIKAVTKLPRLQHVDHSAGDLIHLLQGLLRYDPSDRLTAREALRLPFFTRDQLRR
ncbi:hypothetical protein GH714_043348 [Hevea brasiliensis]|uniref:dual-specificity kinase n=1 Tax=Hevea brasiliensis TaxID=3981 RepID=A0A6A6K2Y7_HEVBR|nr:hypothetical protein GH714_043348 [Hevea brasiliensis]